MNRIHPYLPETPDMVLDIALDRMIDEMENASAAWTRTCTQERPRLQPWPRLLSAPTSRSKSQSHGITSGHTLRTPLSLDGSVVDASFHSFASVSAENALASTLPRDFISPAQAKRLLGYAIGGRRG